MKSRVSQDSIHVVIGIIKNTNNEVLVTRRKSDAHLGGFLEFPGGKLEANETPKAALRRELKEELNIQTHQCLPLMQIPYSYPDRNVLLDVFTVTEYSGTPCANESQELAWKEISTLSNTEFPSANYGIFRALQLPKLISVTPELSQDAGNFMQCFENAVKNEAISLIQLRSHELNHSQYMQLAERCLKICKLHHTKLVLNREAKCMKELNVSGLHLTSNRLLETKERPLGKDTLVSASCHNLKEVQHASKIGLDYIFLGPVVEKNLTPSLSPLNWSNFNSLALESLIPVYAIGGLVVADVAVAVEHGGQGIAAIRGLWQ